MRRPIERAESTAWGLVRSDTVSLGRALRLERRFWGGLEEGSRVWEGAEKGARGVDIGMMKMGGRVGGW